MGEFGIPTAMFAGLVMASQLYKIRRADPGCVLVATTVNQQPHCFAAPLAQVNQCRAIRRSAWK